MDLEPFIASLSPEQPCGADLSFSPEIDAIREMRREDDPSLAQGEWVAPLKTADWAGVARACETLLRTTSKDLAVAGWLTDAWARLRGFAGLAQGLELTAALIERYWPTLHPLADGDDQEQRIGCLAWLATGVKNLAGQITLVEGAGQRLSLVEIEAARQRKSGLEPGVEEAAPQGCSDTPVLTLEAVLRTVGAGGRAGFEARRETIAATRSALLRLQTAVDTQLPDDGPSFAAARAALEHVAQTWERLGRDAGVASPVQATTVAEAEEATAPGAGPAAVPEVSTGGAIRSRAQALQQLRLVADYFRQAEPHSPVAYLADKAARWGEMPLHEWLRAVVKDGAALASFEDLLGVEPRELRG
ncbi:type VI secretion system protein TssA [Azohydromonas caseinilytica]|uniref:Type VI secretion system protein TssA n=1 Tax=Azohydromonas caseinilytica TaxID=2728836 RepID=A0A848FI23_9BURK|nr:type VI secretion system protein TssA [Azohydromonas caseinilytica]NML18796.1 type VI secretion system protein TssA [Azohydromonas caseinilytica]